MEQAQNKITVETLVKGPIEKIWNCWTAPEHITQWYQASEDWHAPNAENDVTPDGRFRIVMSAKDGSFSFDFTGAYDVVEIHNHLSFHLDDGRKVNVSFITENDGIKVVETFEAESINSLELQQQGWQAILNSFKSYTESVPD